MVDEITTTYVTELENIKKVVSNESYQAVIEKATLLDIIKTRSLRKHLAVMAVVNYSITVAYYGSIFFINHLSGIRHVNYMIGSCAEIVGLALLFLVLRQIGTKNTEIVYLYVLAILCASIGLIVQFMPNAYEHKGIR